MDICTREDYTFIRRGSIFQTGRCPEECVEAMGKFYHYQSKCYKLPDFQGTVLG